MPTQNTLVGPFGPASGDDYDDRLRAPVRARPAYRPNYDEDERDRYGYVGTSRTSRIVPFAVAAIAATVIVGGAVLYGAGVIGVPEMAVTPPAPMKETAWEPNPEWFKAIHVQAQQRWLGYPGSSTVAPGLTTGGAAAEGAAMPERAPVNQDSVTQGSLIRPETRSADEGRGMTVAPPVPEEREGSGTSLGLDDPEAGSRNPRQRTNEVAPSAEDEQRREQGDEAANPEGTEDLPTPADPKRAPPEGFGNDQNPY